MNNNIEKIINETISNMINKASSDKKINEMTKKHNKKVHFIPKKYRVFGGILQSLNIQFGNFLPELLSVIISKDNRYEIISKYSGKRNNKFSISITNEKLIDNYITRCQTEDILLNIEFLKLMSNIIDNNDDNMIYFNHDIDLLFKDKKTEIYYYLEIKYNDDHDTDKFVGINRKFIKTSAYLIKELNIKQIENFKPILFFFNNKKFNGNIYVPEETNIYRGKRFFDEFLNIDYVELEKYLLNISESTDSKKLFDNLYEKIVNDKDISYEK